MGDSIEVVDSLDSYDFSAALSANQGRILNNKIENVATTTDIEAIFA